MGIEPTSESWEATARTGQNFRRPERAEKRVGKQLAVDEAEFRKK